MKKLTERQRNLRRWRAAGLCTSCGAKRTRREDGGFCQRCAEIITARYMARTAKYRRRCHDCGVEHYRQGYVVCSECERRRPR